MRFWVFFISDDISEPCQGSGWVRAESANQALVLVDHISANVVEVPDDTGFPAQARDLVYWEHRA